MVERLLADLEAEEAEEAEAAAAAGAQSMEGEEGEEGTGDVDECGLLLRAALSHVLSLHAPNFPHSLHPLPDEHCPLQGQQEGQMHRDGELPRDAQAERPPAAAAHLPISRGEDAAWGAVDGVGARVGEVLSALVGGQGGVVWRRLVRMVQRRVIALPVPSSLIDYVGQLQVASPCRASACTCGGVRVNVGAGKQVCVYGQIACTQGHVSRVCVSRAHRRLSGTRAVEVARVKRRTVPRVLRCMATGRGGEKERGAKLLCAMGERAQSAQTAMATARGMRRWCPRRWRRCSHTCPRSSRATSAPLAAKKLEGGQEARGRG